MKEYAFSPMQLPITSLFALSPTINNSNNIDGGKYSPLGSNNHSSSSLPKISPTPLRRSIGGRKNVSISNNAKIISQSALRKQQQKSALIINNGKLPQLCSYSSPVVSPPLNITGIKKPLSKRQSRSSNSDTSSTFLIQSAPTKVLHNVIINSNEKLPRMSRSYSFNHLQKIVKFPAKDSKVAVFNNNKSAQKQSSKELSPKIQSKVILLQKTTKNNTNNVPSSKHLLSVPKKLVSAKTFGTQTEEFSNLEKLSSKSVSSQIGTEHQNEAFTSVVVQRSTQTDRISFFEPDNEKRLIDSPLIHKMEERSKLYEIIDNALDETIDRNSRMRTNKLIALTAKQQAEVWRDAKIFVTKVLLPSSISLANQSRSSHSPRSPLQRIIENWDQKF